ncbi:hypothetical protein LAZ67_2003900 [Cordylochernes scorpioides]|uniref:Uncharacterized protein n=1 Tax=Cordylochernes scorpioides TaxID=51811 RepID=A0ABY6K3F3_9ARAC|nr:hypothetical protein LAZ67_2003900 [Cordylochernes scorpioides]
MVFYGSDPLHPSRQPSWTAVHQRAEAHHRAAGRPQLDTDQTLSTFIKEISLAFFFQSSPSKHLQKQQQQQPTNGSDPQVSYPSPTIFTRYMVLWQGDGQPAEDSLQQVGHPLFNLRIHRIVVYIFMVNSQYFLSLLWLSSYSQEKGESVDTEIVTGFQLHADVPAECGSQCGQQGSRSVPLLSAPPQLTDNCAVVANAWMETLLDVIDLLPLDIIHRNVTSNTFIFQPQTLARDQINSV